MVTATPTQTVTITRSINSTPEEVYRALTTVTGLQGWLCDNAHLRLEVGGHLHFAWNTPQFHASGEFTEIEENTRLGFTWLGANEDDKTHVTIDIAQDGETVDLTLTHSDVSSGEAAQGYKHEWERTLNNLVSMLETGADHRITKRVIMGILPTGVSDKEREKYGLEEGEGTKINSVLDGYSAQKAGLQADDIVVEVEGQKIDANFNIFRAITAAGKEAGDSVKIVYLRDGERETVDLELLSYPVPDVPDTFDALADRTKATYDEQIATIRNLYAGKSDQITATPSTENEWSADEVVATPGNQMVDEFSAFSVQVAH